MDTAPRILELDRAMVREFLAALFAPDDILHIEAYPKPLRPLAAGQRKTGPDLRLSFKLKELNERHLDRLQRVQNAPTYPANVYVRTNPLRVPHENTPTGKADIARVRHLWLDLDDCPAEAAQQRIAAAGWPPAHLVQRSGGVGRPGNPGTQAWFRLSQPVELPAEAAAMRCWVESVVLAMLKAMRIDEKELTNTYNVDRLLRIAGSWNVKQPTKFAPIQAVLIDRQPEAPTWSLEQWAKALGVPWDPQAGRAAAPAAARPRPPARGSSPAAPGEANGPKAELAPIVAQCAWLRQCKEQASQPGDSATTGTALHEPDWYAALSIIALCQNGPVEAHELCKGFAHYDPRQVDDKIEHAVTAAGPSTCAHVRDKLGHAALCDACPHWGQIKSPISLGYPRRRPVTATTAQAQAAGLLATLAAPKDPPLSETEQRERLNALYAALLDDDWRMRNLTWLRRRQPAAYAALAARLEAGDIGLTKRQLDDLAATLDKLVKGEERRERIKQFKAGQQGEQVLDLLKDAPVSDKHYIPPGFGLGPEGVSKLEVRRGDSEEYFKHISATPLVIMGVLEDVETRKRALQVAWQTGRGWRHVIVPRDTIATAQDIIKPLAELGADVHSRNKMDVVEYFAAYEARNRAEIPTIEATATMGWLPGPRFLLGEQVIAAAGIQPAGGTDPRGWLADGVTFRGRGDGDEDLLKCYHAAGTLEGWLAAVACLAPFPLACVGIYAALASPLLKLLGRPPMIFEYAGRTSVGKTKALIVAASVCGNPDEQAPDRVLKPWSATPNSIGHTAATLQSLPLFYDDTKKVREKTHLTNVIYEFVSGQERPRMNADRSLERAGYWRSVLLSTGEQKISDQTGSAEGAQIRCLSVHGLPFARQDKATAALVDRLERQVCEHYGHAMPALIAWVLAHYADLPTWRTWFEASQDEFAAALADAGTSRENLAARVAGNLAVLQLSVTLAHLALPLPWDPIDIWEVLGAAALESIEGSDAARTAMQLLLEDAVVQRNKYWDEGDPGCQSHEPTGGWRGRWDAGNETPVGFTMRTIAEVLGRAEMDVRQMTRLWQDNDWLTKGPDGYRVVRKINGRATRLLLVPREVVNSVAGSSEDAAAAQAYLRQPDDRLPGMGAPK